MARLLSLVLKHYMKRLNYIFGLIGISFIIFSFSNCGSSKSMDSDYNFKKTPPFIIGAIYSQKWVSGTKEGGSGTLVQVTFNSIEKGVSIEDMYFRNNIIKATQGRNKNQFKGSFKNGNTRDIIMDINPINEAKNTPSPPFPFKLKENEMVISYLNNGRLEYFKIKNIEEKPMLSYPQGNPNSRN